MNLDMLKEIIQAEDLGKHNLFNNKISENEVGVRYVNDMYEVFYTDERAVLKKIKEYATEEEAFVHVLECLRTNKRLDLRRMNKN